MSVDIDTRRVANAKLPLWNTICQSYSAWLYNFLDVLRVSWLWLALVGLMSWLQLSWLGGVVESVKQGVPPQLPSLESRALIYLGGLLWFLASVSITVAWHRRIILGERPRLSGSNLFTGSLWRYVGVGILIALVAFLPVLLIILLVTIVVLPIVAALGAPRLLIGLIAVVGMIVLYLVAITVTLRLSPVLPARAVGDRDRTFKETWEQTRGNSWRLFWGIVACTFLPMIIIQIVAVILFGYPAAQLLGGGIFSSRLGISSAINIICYMLVTPISTNFLAFAYLHFFKRNQIAVFD